MLTVQVPITTKNTESKFGCGFFSAVYLSTECFFVFLNSSKTLESQNRPDCRIQHALSCFHYPLTRYLVEQVDLHQCVLVRCCFFIIIQLVCCSHTTRTLAFLANSCLMKAGYFLNKTPRRYCNFVRCCAFTFPNSKSNCMLF